MLLPQRPSLVVLLSLVPYFSPNPSLEPHLVVPTPSIITTPDLAVAFRLFSAPGAVFPQLIDAHIPSAKSESSKAGHQIALFCPPSPSCGFLLRFFLVPADAHSTPSSDPPSLHRGYVADVDRSSAVSMRLYLGWFHMVWTTLAWSLSGQIDVGQHV